MNQMLATVVALVAIAGVTVYEGVRFGFWNNADPEELNYYAERLAEVPESFGDWMSEPAEVDDAQLQAAQVRAHVSRNYENRKTGAKVNVFLVCGKTHPMAIHSPDQCYAAAGFEQGETSRRYVQANGPTAELWASRFTREVNLQRQSLDILWSWAPHDGFWEAPTNPRPHFSNKNALYKIYVITEPGEKSDDRPAADAFLEDFLPLLDKLLFAPIEAPVETATEAETETAAETTG